MPNIKPAVDGSGDWLRQHKVYREWDGQGGLLFLSGRAGCGKTTLIETLVEAEAQRPDVVVLAFFFDKRGETANRSLLGCLRSLLYQLLEQDRSLLRDFLAGSAFSSRRQRQGQFMWTEKEIRRALEKYLVSNTSEQRRIRLFIDALDESASDEAGALTDWLDGLMLGNQSRLGVCFGSRTWHSAIVPKFNIIVTKENEADLRLYVEERFRRADIDEAKWGAERLANFRVALVDRASGIFQWLVAQTPRILGWLQAGEEPIYINAKIHELPEDLSEVYRDIMTKDIKTSDLSHACRILRWLTFGKFPLSVEDLRYAVCLEGMPKYSSTMEIGKLDSTHWCSSDQSFKDRVKRVCLGLVEFKSVTSFHTQFGILKVEEAACFDHVSLEDFMRTDGITILQERLHGRGKAPAPWQEHLSISHACLAYLQTKEIVAWTVFPLNSDPLPFSAYAAFYWKFHAIEAELGGAPLAKMAGLFSRPQEAGWLSVLQVIRKSELTASDKTLARSPLNIASHFGMTRFVFSMIKQIKHGTVSNAWTQAVSEFFTSGFDMPDINGCTPLLTAAGSGDPGFVSLLLSRGANASRRDVTGSTALHYAAMGLNSKVVDLIVASQPGLVDVQDENGCTPLMQATRLPLNDEVLRALVRHTPNGVHSTKALMGAQFVPNIAPKWQAKLHTPLTFALLDYVSSKTVD